MITIRNFLYKLKKKKYSTYFGNGDITIQGIVLYRNLNDLLNEFVVKYEITFDKLSVSKGRKFFDADLYLDLL